MTRDELVEQIVPGHPAGRGRLDRGDVRLRRSSDGGRGCRGRARGCCGSARLGGLRLEAVEGRPAVVHGGVLLHEGEAEGRSDEHEQEAGRDRDRLGRARAALAVVLTLFRRGGREEG